MCRNAYEFTAYIFDYMIIFCIYYWRENIFDSNLCTVHQLDPMEMYFLDRGFGGQVCIPNEQEHISTFYFMMNRRNVILFSWYTGLPLEPLPMKYFPWNISILSDISNLNSSIDFCDSLGRSRFVICRLFNVHNCFYFWLCKEQNKTNEYIKYVVVLKNR